MRVDLEAIVHLSAMLRQFVARGRTCRLSILHHMQSCRAYGTQLDRDNVNIADDGAADRARLARPCIGRCSQTYTKAAVAADSPQCSQIGAEILRQGGNAVDAAIAAMLGVGVVNLHSTGIGGGGFMVIYDSRSRRSCAIDFRDRAPLNARDHMYEVEVESPDRPSLYGMRK